LTHRPRKRFGQHFLHDPVVIGKIVAAVDPQPGQPLVEIGPGLGAITAPLLERAGALHVIEIDRDLAARLEADLGDRGELIVHNVDALRFDFASLADPGEALRLVGNLPYNISTPLLFRLLERRECIRDMHFMLQREVVGRMVAEVGSREYGRLTIMLAAWCRVERLFDIGPGAFRPPPRVHSSVVRIIPWLTPPFPVNDPAVFARLVNQAFSRRRKTLKNALEGLLSEPDIRAAGADPRLRPECVTPAMFAALADRAGGTRQIG
jgi:16S rRNA (adenine1518-N6/adenine1519-N6)-dimethyltransferase